jgi:DNA-directed RNA polymerase specialized sigma24 family protein
LNRFCLIFLLFVWIGAFARAESKLDSNERTEPLSESELLAAFEENSTLTNYLIRRCVRLAHGMKLTVADCEGYINDTYWRVWLHRETTKYVDYDGLRIFSQEVLRRLMIDRWRELTAPKRSGTVYINDLAYFEPSAPPIIESLSGEDIREILVEEGVVPQLIDGECLSILVYVSAGCAMSDAAKAMGIQPRRAQRRIRALIRSTLP